ncbi:unnamed protein product [Callosobruchus maculatus]|uniref:Uncharacterized protein n=1 Tax=Callosobruchus maculatus TaxID=64391 RepID=A0A653CJP5_CALMS|nr:unnamed protein product [Callosobruchus maculatus]
MCGEDHSVNFKQFNSLDKRLLTFSKWPNHVDPLPIALAGFFYTGRGDICQAFCCGVKLYNWRKGDCPIKDHVKYTKGCVYAKHINKLLQRMCVRKEEEDTSVYSKLQRIPVITAMLCTLVLLVLYLPLLSSAPVYTPHNQTMTRHWFKSGEDSVKWYSQQWISQLYSTTSEMFTQQKNPVLKESYSYNMVDSSTQTSHNAVVVLGERRYPLNKSKSKHVTIGVYPAYNYSPGIKLMGVKGDNIVFTESEWKEFLDYQNVISHNMYATDASAPILTSCCSINVTHISGTPVLKLTKDGSVIYLGYESLASLWNLLPVVNHTVELFKLQKFGNYFRVLQNGLQTQGGDLITNAANLLHSAESFPTENTTMAMEFLYVYENTFKEECNCHS